MRIKLFPKRFVNPEKLLFQFSSIAGVFCICTIFISGTPGLYTLVSALFFESLIILTIYGIASKELDEKESKIGAAGLVMAILGSAFMPLLQGKIIDMGGTVNDDLNIFRISEVNFLFILPIIYFIFINNYGRNIFK